MKTTLRIGVTFLLGLVANNTFLPAQAPIKFVDRSRESGLNRPIVYGGVESQRYILETTGTGVAAFDYDRDGRIDIFLVNGSRLGRCLRRSSLQCIVSKSREWPFFRRDDAFRS